MCLLTIISCEKSDCNKATENYTKYSTLLTNARLAYDTARLATEQACALLDKRAKELDVQTACDTAKKSFVFVEIAFTAAKTYEAAAKASMDAACAK
jgi:hypothetical protein